MPLDPLPQKPSLAMIIATFYPLLGGTEAQALRLSHSLLSLGFDVSVITRQSSPEFASHDKIMGVPVRRLSCVGSGLGSSFWFSVLLALYLWKKRKRFHIYHAHMADASALMTSLMGLLLRKPVVVKIAGGGKFGELKSSQGHPLKRLKLACLRRLVSAFISPSREAYEELLQAGFPKEKLHYIPNGVDTEYFYPAPATLRNSLRTIQGWSSAKIALYIGRFEEEKGIPVLLEAWKMIPREYSLVLVGEGRLSDHVSKFSSQWPGVRVYSPVTDVRPFLQAADLFVLPSLSEGLSNALLEAMACGLPVVATKTGGTLDAVQDGHEGILVSVGDREALAKAISQLFQEEAFAVQAASNSRRKILESFSLLRTTNSTINLYLDLLRSQRYTNPY